MILVVVTAASLPVGLDMVAVLLMIIASVAFLLSPAMLDSHRSKHHPEPNQWPPGPGDDVMNNWSPNST